jgi:hypothetical protein
VLVGWLQAAIVGMGLGMAVGALLSVAWKLHLRGLLWDGLLGAVGFAGGVIGCAMVRWPKTTVTHTADGAVLTSTTLHYQHPYFVATVLAVFFTAVRAIYRLKHSPERVPDAQRI